MRTLLWHWRLIHQCTRIESSAFRWVHELQRIRATAEKAAYFGTLGVQFISLLISNLDLERDSDDLSFATTSESQIGEKKEW
jgi:hypothetical protein